MPDGAADVQQLSLSYHKHLLSVHERVLELIDSVKAGAHRKASLIDIIMALKEKSSGTNAIHRPCARRPQASEISVMSLPAYRRTCRILRGTSATT